MIQGIVPNQINQTASSSGSVNVTFDHLWQDAIWQSSADCSSLHLSPSSDTVTPWHRSGGNCYDPVDVEGQKKGWPRILNKTKGPRKTENCIILDLFTTFCTAKVDLRSCWFQPHSAAAKTNLAPTSNAIGGQIKRAACAWWCHTSSVVSGDDQWVAAVDSVPTSAAKFHSLKLC